MTCKQILFICLIFIFWDSYSIKYVTNPRVKFERYSISEGLSHLGVSSFGQDSKGFLWIATYDGLNRFDGINFKVFKRILDDSTTLSNNRVRCVFEHSSGKLLIGTEGGLCVYNSENESFGKFSFGSFDNTSGSILKMFEDSSHRLWILTNKNIAYVLDLENKDSKSLLLVPNDKNSSVFYQDIVEDSKGFLWLATSNGLFCYSRNLQFVPLDLPRNLMSGLIRCIELDEENNLWISLNSMVSKLKINYNEDNIQLSTIQDFQLKSLILTLLIDKKKNIWVGTSNDGVFRIVTAQKELTVIENYNYEASLKESISSNWISSIYEDKVGNIWFATAEQGINKYRYDKEIFLNIDHSLGLQSNYVLELFQVNEHIVLCGTRSGVSVFDLSKEIVIKSGIEKLFLDNFQVPAIYKDSRGILWFGASNGLFYLEPGKTKLLAIKDLFDQQTIDFTVSGIIEDEFKNLWVGTTIGIFRLSFDTNGKLIQSLNFNTRNDNLVKNIRISELYLDPLDNSLWAGTWYSGLYHLKISGLEEGVNDYNIDKHHFIPSQTGTLRSNFISTILRTKNGDLWVGTEGGGISRMDSQAGPNTFIHITEKNGLSNNVVKSILEDSSGKLYIGTNYKLNVYDPQTNSFKYYDVKDGLKSDYFNRVAIKLTNNEMIFGGNEGITIFNPTKMETLSQIPIPEFGDFQLSYKTVHPGERIDGELILEKGLSFTREIHLKNFQNTFSIELLGISFDDPEDNHYKYKLTDYDQDWIYTKPADNLASYSNVPPGEYQFEFYVSTNENEWTPNSKQLLIIISPPFWKSGWAYSLYFFLFTGIVVAVFYFLLNIERLKSNLKIEQLEKEKEKEINDVKLRFFTNISHEFKTPVSLILGPAETLINKFRTNDSVRRNLMMIHEQASYLLRLLDQLLEFRKVENESVKLKCVENDIIGFVKHIVKGFDPKSIEKNIKYKFHHSEETILLWFDPSKIEMIVYNLLSNAFKFTPSGGSITVSVESDIDSFVTIKVKDSGFGISKEDQLKIFDRFYQSQTTVNLHGTGIGLALSKSLTMLHHGELIVESELGRGASFILKLRTGRNHFSFNEAIIEKQENVDKFILENKVSIQIQSYEKIKPRQEIRKNIPLLLLVEDNFQMRNYLEEILSEHYNVILTDNGSNGFDKACKKLPDLIVSDVMMPGLNGIQLTEKLKNETITSHIPIILLTAKDEFESFMKGIETGADDYISKPFHIEHLLVRIKNLIENRVRLRTHYGINFKDDPAIIEEQLSIRDNEFVHILYQIIEKNLDNVDFSANDFSKAVFMSRTNFYKKLKALTDETPGEFLRMYRIKRAKELLSTGSYSISQVASMVGFKSRSHFYQCFQNQYIDLPSDFIRKIERQPQSSDVNHQSDFNI